jgi:hypothetical protein
MIGSSILVAGIKSRLRALGMSYQDVAAKLGVSEATVKRDMARGNFSLRRLDEICKMLGVGVVDLTLLPESAPLTQLSEQQERTLVADPRLLLITYLVTNDWKFSEIVNAFELAPDLLIDALLKVDQLRIIDFTPPTRIRRLTSRNFSWRKDGPIQEYFLSRVVPEFFAGRFETAGDELRFFGAALSPASMLRLQASLQRVAGEFEHLSQQDARLPRDQRHRCAAILGLRKWEFSEFAKLRSARRPARPLIRKRTSRKP